MSNTYYMSTTGVDTNNGLSANSPVRTFTRLNQLLQQGDVAYVAPGTYTKATSGTILPANNTGFLHQNRIRIIADKSGQVFGVPAGDVIVDWQGTYDPTNPRPIHITGAWQGLLHIIGFRFINVFTTLQAVGTLNAGSLIYVNTTGRAGVTIEDCSTSNFATSGSGQNVDGLMCAILLNHASTTVQFKNCTLSANTSNANLFNITSNIGASSTIVPRQTLSLIDTVVTTDANTVAPSFISANYRYSLNAHVISNAGFLRLYMKGCRVAKPDGNEIGAFFDAINTGEFQVENCYIASSDFILATNASALHYQIRSFKISGSQIVSSRLFSVNPSYEVFAENSSFKQTTITTSQWGGQGSVFEMSKCYLEFANGQVNLNPNSWTSTVLEDCIVTNVSMLSASANHKATSLTRVNMVNIGVNNTGTVQAYAFTNINAQTTLSNCLLLKSTPVTAFYFSNTWGAGTTILDGVIASGNVGIAGASGYTQSNYGLIANQPSLTRHAFLPNVVVPELITPLSGLQSACVPVPAIGRGIFKVILDGGRENVITLNASKSWTGGTVQFFIDGIYVGTASDVLSEQSITLRYTPSTSGIYELEVYGRDTVSLTTCTAGYSANKILIDNISVT